MARNTSIGFNVEIAITNVNSSPPPTLIRPSVISSGPSRNWGAGDGVAGTGPNQWQKTAYWSWTFVASTPQVIDLQTIKTMDGGAGFAHIREIIIVNGATNPFKLLAGDSGANGFKDPFDGVATGKVAVMPGLPMVISNWLATLGWVVGATNKDLKLDPGANAFPVELFFKGD